MISASTKAPAWLQSWHRSMVTPRGKGGDQPRHLGGVRAVLRFAADLNFGRCCGFWRGSARAHGYALRRPTQVGHCSCGASVSGWIGLLPSPYQTHFLRLRRARQRAFCAVWGQASGRGIPGRRHPRRGWSLLWPFSKPCTTSSTLSPRPVPMFSSRDLFPRTRVQGCAVSWQIAAGITVADARAGAVLPKMADLPLRPGVKGNRFQELPADLHRFGRWGVREGLK